MPGCYRKGLVLGFSWCKKRSLLFHGDVNKIVLSCTNNPLPIVLAWIFKLKLSMARYGLRKVPICMMIVRIYIASLVR